MSLTQTDRPGGESQAVDVLADGRNGQIVRSTPDAPASGRVLDALARLGRKVRQTRPGQWQAQCPCSVHAHGDRNPSLSITQVRDKTLLTCWAGGDLFTDVLPALGLTIHDLFDNRRDVRYPYRDNGRVVRTVVRQVDGKSGPTGKNIWQDIVDPSKVPLYRLDEGVAEAVAAGRDVYICEGEQDADTLASVLGVAACSAPQGARNWALADYKPLLGASDLYIVADLDKPGLDRARGLRDHLRGLTRQPVRVLLPARGNDAGKHVEAGYGISDFIEADDETLAAIDPRPTPPKDTPAQDAPAPETLQEGQHGGETGEADPWEQDVADEAHRLRVREAARAIVAAEKTPPAPPFDLDTLAGVLAREPEPPFRVDRLAPADAGLLLSAMRKTGKTTTALNLARCLLSGEPFLDEFEVQPISGTIAFLNFEVSAATIAKWGRLVGIDERRLHLVNLRGRRNPLAHDEDRQQLGRLLRSRDVETVIVDPYTRAFTGDNQDSASQVGAFCNVLDVFVRTDVGARDLILTAHTGWDGERSRGSSELEGWADSIIRLTRGTGEDSRRYIRAEGRDVDLEERQLAYDSDTHHLTLSGHGSRATAARQQAAADLRVAVLDFVRINPGCSGEQIRAGVEGANSKITDARKSLVDSGHLIEDVRGGKGGGNSYRIGNPAQPRPTPPGGVPNPAAPPYKGRAEEKYDGEVSRDETGRGSEQVSA